MIEKKIKKASLGLLAMGDLLKRSQTARDIGGKLGLIPKLVSDYYQGKADKKTGQVLAKQKGGGVDMGKDKKQKKVINPKNRREDLMKIQNPISEGDLSYTSVNKGGSILKKQKMMHGGEVEIGNVEDYIKDLL